MTEERQVVSFVVGGVEQFAIDADEYSVLERQFMSWGCLDDELWRTIEIHVEFSESDFRVCKLTCPRGITSFSPSLGRLGALRELDLYRTWRLTSLPQEIGDFGELTKLNLRNSGINTIPPSIRRLQNLKELNLSYSNVTSLPDEIGDLGNLVVLDLSKTNIASLPPSIGGWNSLQELDLSSTRQLTSLPEEIGNLCSLKALDLTFSGVTALPTSIGGCQALQELFLCRIEQLTSLPNEIGNLTNLTHLNLQGSGITSLPPSIGQLRNLEGLDLRDTEQLKCYPQEMGDLGNLVRLTLCESGVTSLPPSIEYALACKRFRSRAATHSMTTMGWPLLLETAKKAFRPYGPKHMTSILGLDQPDAIYCVLADYRESFLEMLIHRNDKRNRDDLDYYDAQMYVNAETNT
mmetsp:Transcript_5141/g.12273  ORF Transcript_5141/g.12273 Transcript_5141/m.12273 type:complete len:406 (+) Transcript_5141:57-1274(+)